MTLWFEFNTPKNDWELNSLISTERVFKGILLSKLEIKFNLFVPEYFEKVRIKHFLKLDCLI